MKQIEELQAKAAKASAAIDQRSTRFSSDADAATSIPNEKVNAANLVGSQILAAPKTDRDGESSGNPNQEAVDNVLDASEALKVKPEDAFTAADFYARGLADYTNKNYQSALLAFENTIRKLGQDAPAQQSSEYLFAKASTLELMDKPEQEIAVYDEIDQRFGKDIAPRVRKQVVKAFNGGGLNQTMAAKEQWAEQTVRKECLTNAEAVLQHALLQCAQGDRAMILGNLGYMQFLLGKLDVVKVSTKEGFRLGGQQVLDAQLADAKLHHVEPQDTAYETVLAEIWNSL